MAASAATGLAPWLLVGALGTLNMFVNHHSRLLVAQDRLQAVKDTRITFDFIVVGGGSAGAVLANRLSEIYDVLLLEAGGIPNPLQSIPALTNPLLGQPNLDWKYVTTPQKHSCFGMINQTYGTGLLSSGGVQSLALIALNSSATELNKTPEIQSLLVANGMNTLGTSEMARSSNTPPPLAERFWGKAKSAFVEVANIALRPHSKADERDLTILVEGAKRVVEIIENSKAFHGARLLNESYPGCETVPFRSDEYWACLHRQLTIPGHHQVGTCSMGKPDSAQTVVDSKLRVIGVENLRVVDGSIFPTLTTGNTNAPIIMMAEKASDLIKDAWDIHKDTKISSLHARCEFIS